MTINVGVIGASGIGKNHALTVSKFPGRSKLAAIADSDAERLRILTENFEVRAYESAEDLIAGSCDRLRYNLIAP